MLLLSTVSPACCTGSNTVVLRLCGPGSDHIVCMPPSSRVRACIHEVVRGYEAL